MAIDQKQSYEPEVPTKTASQLVVELDREDDRISSGSKPEDIRKGRQKKIFNRDTVLRLIDVIKDK